MLAVSKTTKNAFAAGYEMACVFREEILFVPLTTQPSNDLAYVCVCVCVRGVDA